MASFAAMMLPIVLWQVVEPERYANILSAYRLYDAAGMPGWWQARSELLSAEQACGRVLDICWDAFNPAGCFSPVSRACRFPREKSGRC